MATERDDDSRFLRAAGRENQRGRGPFRKSDRIGRRRDFTFDDAGRQTGEVWYSWPSVIDGAYTLTYDAVGRVATGKMGTGSGRRTPQNRTLIPRPVPVPIFPTVDLRGKVLTMAYDAAGNRTQLQDSDGGTTDSTFDALGRLTRTTARLGLEARQPDDFALCFGRVSARIACGVKP